MLEGFLYKIVEKGDGCAKVEQGFPQSEERDNILNFIRNSKRGIVRAGLGNEKGVME